MVRNFARSLEGPKQEASRFDVDKLMVTSDRVARAHELVNDLSERLVRGTIAHHGHRPIPTTPTYCTL